MDQFTGRARLPKFAVPNRYDLTLKPDLDACTFSGSVHIDLDIVSDTSFIVLNAADLTLVPGSVLFNTVHKILEPENVELVEEDEILVLGFSDNLPLGKGVLTIWFEGVLEDNLKGFYRSEYEIDGDTRNMAVTQFEPADARRCFPCWDEPVFKATFKITLKNVPSDLVALSNMPIVEEKSSGHLKTISYEESPMMSTYLVAVVIGLFDFIEDHTIDGTKVRIYCPVGKTDQGKFALDVAVKSLEIYKEYFGVPYSLPKLDMVAVPDFAAGAMENYGLVTYRDTDLLFDENHSAASNKQNVSISVTHELAHQWFGNLVTMEWWTHLWLNEGFATWVSYLATDVIFPQWNIWTQFLDESSEALRLDGLAESHPIEVDINKADEIDEIFDAISYSKGASLVRMLQSYLGAEVFQLSLAAYINKHACSNAKTEDLWIALEEESEQPVNTLMNSWTRQQGYPVISVKINGGTLEFDQSQFLTSGAYGDGQWIVPLTLCVGSYECRHSYLLEEESGFLDVKGVLDSFVADQNCNWVKLNVDQTGFYRVKYDDELAARLRYAIQRKQLSTADRFGVLDDSFALCMARQLSMTSLLTLMDAYGEELEYIVLSNLLDMCRRIVRIIADAKPEMLDSIKIFFIKLLQLSADKIGWDPKEGESHSVSMLRGEILAALTVFGHDATCKEGSRRFKAFIEDNNTPLLPPDIRRSAYVAVMQKTTSSNRQDYESLLKIYRETDLSEERARILSSLPSCPDLDIVLEALNFLLSNEVRNQDAVIGLAVCKEGREVAWEWLKDNWEYISETWGTCCLIPEFISAIVSPFASIDKAKEVDAFFATRTTPSIARTLKQSIERIHINVGLVESIQSEKQQLEDVVTGLASHGLYPV
ncbi:unnamed protein product [Rhodiola kirilowii]